MLFLARDDLVYRQPLLTRAAGAAFAVAVLALLVAAWPQVLDLPLPRATLPAFAALWFGLAAGCVRLALNARVAFIFGTDGVASREWWGTRTLPYADMAGCTVLHEERKSGRGPAVGGHCVTFEAMRSGTPPLVLFVRDDLPLDIAIVRRLRTVPGLSRRQLKILELATTEHAHSDRMARQPAGEV